MFVSYNENFYSDIELQISGGGRMQHLRTSCPWWIVKLLNVWKDGVVT